MIVKINSEKSSLCIDKNGGRIVRLTLNAVPILGTFTRIDGKNANTHICVPNFAKEGITLYQLPSHGPFRNLEWDINYVKKKDIYISCTMPKIGKYPTVLFVQQHFSITKTSFTHTIVVENIGKKEGPVNCAVHYYFFTPYGWKNLTINDENVSYFIQRDTYKKLDNIAIISIPRYRKITMRTKSFSYIQLWSGRIKDKIATKYDVNYACIEPLFGIKNYFNSEKSMLFPQKKKTYTVNMSL